MLTRPQHQTSKPKVRPQVWKLPAEIVLKVSYMTVVVLMVELSHDALLLEDYTQNYHSFFVSSGPIVLPQTLNAAPEFLGAFFGVSCGSQGRLASSMLQGLSPTWRFRVPATQSIWYLKWEAIRHLLVSP